jgi:signal transduction histidine kinase
MNDRRVLFPLLLFAIFFILIAITGFFQIAIMKRNMEGLLRAQGETMFSSIAREIEMSMEYLAIVEKSPSIITPNVLNVMTYDEAIVDDIVARLSSRKTDRAENTALPANMLVMSRNGQELERKGQISVDKSQLDVLVKTDQQNVIRLPRDDDPSLFMGIKLPDKLIFFVLGPKELESLRQTYVVKTIVENEQKRLGIAEINIYDESGKAYLGSGQQVGDVLSVRMPLKSRYFPQYSMEILVSNRLTTDSSRRTSINFVLLLSLLILGGAGGIYVIFGLERRYAESLQEIEKDMIMKERLVSLGKLSSGMAHEIRNPLNAIGMSIQRLKREFTPGEGKVEEYQKFLDIVRSEVLRVNRIVEEFLLSTKSGMAMEHQKINSILEEVIVMLRERASDSGTKIEYRGNLDVSVVCQKERLKQVFYNLILNGMEATGKGGIISVSSETSGSNVRVLVRDMGPGIKKEDLHRVFEYYYTTKDKGMGLGLPLSYLIVKDHGGDIRVQSEEGKGAVFTITLPVRKGS